MEHVIKPVIPAKYLTPDTIYHLNPSGRFVIGGPHGDAGLTGRKIIIDTYGGWGAHGGGAFSGQGPDQGRPLCRLRRALDRQVAGGGEAWHGACLVQVSATASASRSRCPSSWTSYGSGSKPDRELLEIVKNNFDLRPGVIIRDLGLTRPIYSEDGVSYGHFGRDDKDFTWEQVKTLKY